MLAAELIRLMVVWPPMPISAMHSTSSGVQRIAERDAAEPGHGWLPR